MKINRRTLLRGMLGGAAVTVGLPALECFLNTNGTATNIEQQYLTHRHIQEFYNASTCTDNAFGNREREAHNRARKRQRPGDARETGWNRGSASFPASACPRGP